MENNGVNMDNVDFVIGPTDSYWTRDYGPWWIVDGNSDVSMQTLPTIVLDKMIMKRH